MSPLGRPPVYPDIVEEHFDELDFLLELRDRVICSEKWTLPLLAAHEGRVEAHLDGLRLSELHGVDLALARIEEGDTYAAAAASLVLEATGEGEHRQAILDALRGGPPESLMGILTALRHRDLGPFRRDLEDLNADADPLRAATAASLLAFSRMPAKNLDVLSGHESSEVRVLAMGAAGRLGELYQREIAAGVEAPNLEVRRAALEAAARLGVSGLIRHCRAASARDPDPDPEAVYFVGVLGDRSDLPLLESLLSNPDLGAVATAALGALGLVEGVPLLLDLMGDDTLGVPATAAYKRITGADDVEGEKPYPPPEEEDETDDLPPDPEKALADWESRKSSMVSGVQWQRGIAIAPDRFPLDVPDLTLQARKDIYLRQRAYYGSSIPDLELEALAGRQNQPIRPVS